MSSQPPDQPPLPATSNAGHRAQVEDRRAVIDALMAGPVKRRPRITVVGDDAVSGINPALRPAPRA
jgi:hypothetical protein